jgi:hypothetical protein
MSRTAIISVDGHVKASRAVHKILFDNAATVYRFDRAVLLPHVDRVGFEVGAKEGGTGIPARPERHMMMEAP